MTVPAPILLVTGAFWFCQYKRGHCGRKRALQEAGFEVKVKGPPPDLQTGCDMVVVFPVLKQAAVEKVLKEARLEPEKIITEADALLDPCITLPGERFGTLADDSRSQHEDNN